MTFDELLGLVVDGFEALGVGILVVGSIVGIVGYARDVRELDRTLAYERLRTNIGRTILLGLEVLIVADIVRTIIVDATFESVAVLGVIVLIRILLSLSLEVEIEGAWPWRRGQAGTTGGQRE